MLPEQPNTLGCTYWGREVGPHTFKILANGTVIATKTLDGSHAEAFYMRTYEIPAELPCCK